MTPVFAALTQFIRDPGGVTDGVVENLVSIATGVTPWFVAASVAACATGIAALCLHGLQERRMASGGQVLEIALPPDVNPAAAETFWTNTHDLLRPRIARVLFGQPHVGFEMHWSGPELSLRMWVPKAVNIDIIRRALASAWPGAEITDIGPQKNGEGKKVTAIAGELRLATNECLPIKADFDIDPIRTIAGAVGELRESEFAIVQVLARPVTGKRSARAARKGHKVLDVAPTKVISASATKMASLCWETVVRYGVGEESSSGVARSVCKSRAHGLASAFAVFTDLNRFERHRCRGGLRRIRSYRMGGGDLMSVGELAAIAHLPADLNIAGISRAGAKTVMPHPRTPKSGKQLGDSQGIAVRPVAIAPKDSCFHLHVLGSTGSGKSTLLTNLVLDDVENGRGAVVIDPKGDLVVDVLERLDRRRLGKVELIDPANTGKQSTMNILQYDKKIDSPELVVENLIGIFSRVFGAHWGPRTDDLLRSACLTLLRTGETTLAEVPKLLSNKRFRAETIAGLNNQSELKSFWSWYEQMSDAQRSQVVGPVMNKLRAFLLREFVTDVVGTYESSLRLDEVLDGGLLLVRIPKGIVGDETSKLIGSFVVAKVWQAATARAARTNSGRKPASLYVDECQNFLNLPRSFDEMLAEARGYGLSLILAHQHLGQLSKELGDAISANARNKVFLNMSPEDARVLERHVSPNLGAHDLANLGAYQAALRLVANGADLPSCTVKTRLAIPKLGDVNAIRGVIGKRLATRRRSVSGDRQPRQVGSGPGHMGGNVAGPMVGTLGVSDPNPGEHPASGAADPEMTVPDFYGDG